MYVQEIIYGVNMGLAKEKKSFLRASQEEMWKCLNYTGLQSSRGSEFLPHHPNLDLNFFPDDNSYFCLQTPK